MLNIEILELINDGMKFWNKCTYVGVFDTTYQYFERNFLKYKDDIYLVINPVIALTPVDDRKNYVRVPKTEEEYNDLINYYGYMKSNYFKRRDVMPKFRKKPVEIEAMQFNGDILHGNYKEVMQFVGEELSYSSLTKTIEIPTLEGTMTASDGDWIIEGVNGEFYPCKPDIFEKTYDKVED